jgi:long-chain acyl-CoA synthetase
MGQVQAVAHRGTLVKVDEEVGEDESPVYRSSVCFLENGGQLISTFRSQPESRTTIQILRTSAGNYPGLDCVGERELLPDGTHGRYKWTSYSEFYGQVLAIGRGLLELGFRRGDRIGLYSPPSIYWQMVHFGVGSVGMVLVPVYDSLGKNAAQHICNHSEVKCLFVAQGNYANAVAIIPQLETLECVVVLTPEVPAEPSPEPHPSREVRILAAPEVIQRGRESNQPNNFGDPDEVAIIMYTSGTTGEPKGCMLTGANVVAGSASLAKVNCSVLPGDTQLSWLPLAHIYSLSFELFLYVQGGRVGFARGGVPALMGDIKELQPTLLIGVPRILNRVCENMKAGIAKKSWIAQKVLYWAIDRKVQCMLENRPHSLLLDALLFSAFRDSLGGKLRALISSAAPILPDTFAFFTATVTPNVCQGYGLTETSGGCCVQEIPAMDPHAVGSPGVGDDIKLRPVPDTEYKPRGREQAGELLVRGPAIFKGYYKNPELTAEVLKDGWFATGDVVRITPQGELQVIDRVKQLIKLSQGEYLSMTSLNDHYNNADLAAFVYVYANSKYDQPVAVVVPKKEKIEQWQSSGIQDIISDQSVNEEVMESLKKVHKERGLRGFERIGGVIIDLEEPTMENGLLTPSQKPQLVACKKRYEERLLELYETVVRPQAAA